MKLIWLMSQENQKCVFKCGVKYHIMNSTKSATSTMYTANAVGIIMPPYVVYKAEHLWDTWMVGGPKGSRYNRSKSGWFEMKHFQDWFLTFLQPYCKKFSGPKSSLETTFQVIFPQMLSKHVKIKKNSIHLCQPLDVVYYGPMKRHWRDILIKWKKTDCCKTRSFQKEVFLQLLRMSLPKVLKT